MTIYGKGIFAGGGLDLTVVGSSQRPLNPSPNTIWIKTSAAIERVCFGPVWGISDKQVGDIWVDTSSQYMGVNDGAQNSTTRLLAVCGLPCVVINILQVNRWNGAEWTRCEGSVYANNKWSNMAMYLFCNGTRNSAYPLVCGRAQGSATTLSLTDQPVFGSDHMVVQGKTSAVYGVVTTPDMTGVEVEGFTAMGLKYCIASGSLSSGRLYCGLTDAVYSPVSYSNADNVQSRQLEASYDVQEASMTINASGVLRPTLKFQSSSTAPLELAVYYWVLS